MSLSMRVISTVKPPKCHQTAIKDKTIFAHIISSMYKKKGGRELGIHKREEKKSKRSCSSSNYISFANINLKTFSFLYLLPFPKYKTTKKIFFFDFIAKYKIPKHFNFLTFLSIKKVFFL